MKLKLITLALGVLMAQGAFANGTQASPAPQPNPAAAHNIPQTPEQWLERMTDFTRNASAYRDPKVFVPWSNAVTEPGFYTQMGVNMMEPNNWYRMFGSMMDPRSLTNYMQFADPNMYAKWMAASMDPNFYTALMTQWADPGKMMRWAMMPMDPKVWGMMMQALNPNMYLKWMMQPIDPKLWSLMMQPMNPNLYTAWMGQSLNPQTYGAWGTWLNPSSYTVPGMGGMGGPIIAPVMPNSFDPTAWLKMTNPAAWTNPAAASVAGAAPAGMVNVFDPNTLTRMSNPAGHTAAVVGTGPAPAGSAAPAIAHEQVKKTHRHRRPHHHAKKVSDKPVEGK